MTIYPVDFVHSPDEVLEFMFEILSAAVSEFLVSPNENSGSYVSILERITS